MTDTIAAANQRARFWQHQAEQAEDARDRLHASRDAWRAYAFDLGREYLAELGKQPTTRPPTDMPGQLELPVRPT